MSSLVVLLRKALILDKKTDDLMGNAGQKRRPQVLIGRLRFRVSRFQSFSFYRGQSNLRFCLLVCAQPITVTVLTLFILNQIRHR